MRILCHQISPDSRGSRACDQEPLTLPVGARYRSGAGPARFAKWERSRRAGGVVERCSATAKRISPHSLRHSFITAAFDAGCRCGMYRSPPATPTRGLTTRYDRARHNLDRHASYIVTAFVAGAA
jgi:integrase